MIHMPLNLSEISFLCKGNAAFEAMPSLKKLPPFSELACDFLAELSAEIMKTPEARQYPDVITFGFFCRKGNILKLKSNYGESLARRLGRGVSHIAWWLPSLQAMPASSAPPPSPSGRSTWFVSA